jgi:hypothetical protein
MEDDWYFHPEMEKAIALIRTGAVVAPAREMLPTVG